MCLLFITSASIHSAYAAAPPFLPSDAGTPECTSSPTFDDDDLENFAAGDGLISIIIIEVKKILDKVAKDLYEGIIGSGAFVDTVEAVATLYIAIYGILFTAGMVQATITDITIRGVKLGIVGMLIQPGSWLFFESHVIEFFNTGTDDIINQLTAIAVGGVSVAGDPPFQALDDALTKALSAKMAVSLFATFTAGPNGFLIGLLILACVGSFIKTTFKALWVYLMSLVIKTLMFGLAPLFISFLMFSRTKHLFDGWLNQIVSASLQPIFLFAFFGFFAKLVESLIEKTMAHPVCWTELRESFRGSPFGQRMWRPQESDGAGGYIPFDNLITFSGMVTPAGTTDLPFNIVVALTFLIVADLSSRFNEIVINVAKDIAGASTNISAMAGAMGQWFENQAGGATSRPEPGTPGGPSGPPRPPGAPRPPISAGPPTAGGTGDTSTGAQRSSRDFIDAMSSMIARRDR
jgi:type IV secretory pathway VirB6-like protein